MKRRRRCRPSPDFNTTVQNFHKHLKQNQIVVVQIEKDLTLRVNFIIPMQSCTSVSYIWCQLNIWKPVRQREQEAMLWPGSCASGRPNYFQTAFIYNVAPPLLLLANHSGHHLMTHSMLTRVPQPVQQQTLCHVCVYIYKYKSFSMISQLAATESVRQNVSGDKMEKARTVLQVTR